MRIEFNITPIGKPRMTQRDKWAKRDVVVAYYAFKDRLREEAEALGFRLPDQFSVDFWLPMPASWSAKKRAAMDGTPHQQTPDLDNLEKGLFDCLREDDAGVWAVAASKRWGTTGKIVIEAT